MTEERLEEAEGILAAYVAKYGLSDEARRYFADSGCLEEHPPRRWAAVFKKHGLLDCLKPCGARFSSTIQNGSHNVGRK
ncbi:hypothetical protein ACSQ76_08365 [Roseovarius sp. B08]|uniref:hypothetical protein n=1 Tax=Roseovarius sp. B08 TaxID=3449223 RepID=UPI003EDB88DC